MSASVAAAAPSVTTARLTPRSRNAGSPMTIPHGTAHRPATISEKGNPIPQLCETWPSMKPPIPASDIWASETWPTYPVRTTSESAMQVNVIEVMKALRSDPCSTTSTARPSTKQTPAVTSGLPGRATEGLRRSTSSPRARTLRARSAIVTMMTMNGSASGRPCWGSQVHTVCSLMISDCAMPSASPASAMIQNDWKRPTSATPSAGTMNSV